MYPKIRIRQRIVKVFPRYNETFKSRKSKTKKDKEKSKHRGGNKGRNFSRLQDDQAPEYFLS